MLRVLLSAIIGAAVVFGCGYVAWEVLDIHGKLESQQMLPTDGEQKLLEGAAGQAGVYVFPDTSGMSEEAEKKAYAEGPSGVLFLAVGGREKMSPMMLVWYGVACLGAALFASILVGMSRMGNYFARLVFVLLLGVFTSIVAFLPVWLWHGAPLKWVLANAAEVTGTWYVAGLFIAAIAPWPKKKKDDSIDVKL